MITDNLAQIRKNIPEYVQLVCVSKFHPASYIEEAYQAGERIFGESRVQELCEKWNILPKDIHWHFIGHLQSNKIKYIIPFVELIHGVDSYKLLSEINRAAKNANKVVNCLLQVHIAQEETKFGFSEKELCEMLSQNEWKTFKNVQICGLMGMASLTSDKERIANEFSSLKTLFDFLKTAYFSTNSNFKELSMGMSDDYTIAIKQGSTMVRIGSSIFGNRNY